MESTFPRDSIPPLRNKITDRSSQTQHPSNPALRNAERNFRRRHSNHWKRKPRCPKGYELITKRYCSRRSCTDSIFPESLTAPLDDRMIIDMAALGIDSFDHLHIKSAIVPGPPLRKKEVPRTSDPDVVPFIAPPAAVSAMLFANHVTPPDHKTQATFKQHQLARQTTRIPELNPLDQGSTRSSNGIVAPTRPRTTHAHEANMCSGLKKGEWLYWSKLYFPVLVYRLEWTKIAMRRKTDINNKFKLEIWAWNSPERSWKRENLR